MNINRISGLKLFLFLFLASLVIYFGSLRGDFLLDDQSLIVNNPDIRHLSSVPSLFSGQIFKYSFPAFDVRYNYYRPIFSLFCAFIYQFCGLNPLGYHLGNLILHSLNAFLVFCLIYKLFAGYPVAFLSSLLFLVHPLNTESVSYISNSGELLITLFVLLTVLSYMSYLASRKSIRYIASLFCFILALLSREAGFLVFVPFFILFIGVKNKLPKITALAHFLTFIGILVIYIRLRLSILVPINITPSGGLPFWADILNFSNVLSGYVKLLIFPASLHLFRSVTPILTFYSLRAIVPVILCSGLLYLLVISIKRKKYILLFGITWFVLGALHIIRFMYKIRGHIVMEEHWIYFASIGFCVVVSYFILSIKRPKLAPFTGACLVIAYGSLTFINSWHWRDELKFYRYNIRLIEPSLSVILRLNYSTALYKRGLFEEAIQQAGSILSIDPKNLYAYIELGDIYYAMKKFPEAKQAYRNALKIDYFCWQAYRKLKLVTEESGEVFKDEIDPRLSPVEAEIISLMRSGEYEKALGICKDAMEKAASPQLYTLSGIIFGKMGLYNRAAQAFNAALKIDPKYYKALYNLSVIYERNNEMDKLMQIRNKMVQIEAGGAP